MPLSPPRHSLRSHLVSVSILGVGPFQTAAIDPLRPRGRWLVSLRRAPAAQKGPLPLACFPHTEAWYPWPVTILPTHRCPIPRLEVSMAEQEPTAEQLAQIAAENEEDEHSVNYKPPAQKSIQEIQELDKDDESLRKYKEALLGRVAVSAGEWPLGMEGGGQLSSSPAGTPVTLLKPLLPLHCLAVWGRRKTKGVGL